MNTRFELASMAAAALLCTCAAALAQAPFGLPPSAPAAKPQPGTPQAPAQPARRAPSGGALFIAGDGFSLDQAVDDGIRESGGRPFAVLVLNAEISKLGIHGATSETTAAISRARKSGGTLYLCDRDVRRLGFAAHEILPGVQTVRGFDKAEAESSAASASKPGAAPLAPLPRMRAICAG
jgi:hypothetical protein